MLERFEDLDLDCLFVIPEFHEKGEEATVLVKQQEGGKFLGIPIRGPDHHGRIIYDTREDVEIEPWREVQRIAKQSINEYLS